VPFVKLAFEYIFSNEKEMCFAQKKWILDKNLSCSHSTVC
jgi:hypothetical protein